MHQRVLLRAIDFAARKHRAQRRKDEAASPYINHPVSVALLLAEVGGVSDPDILSAAILHDTLEDTETTAAELEAAFGSRVRALVQEVSDDRSLPKSERKRLQVEHARSLSQGAALIKLGDKIDNVRDIMTAPPRGWSLPRRTEYLDWAEAVVRACPPTSQALLDLFDAVIAEGRAQLVSAPAPA